MLTIIVPFSSSYRPPLKINYYLAQSLIKNNQEILTNEDINIIDEYTYEVYNITNSIKKGSKLKKVIYNYKNPIFNSMKNKKIGSFMFNDCVYNSNYDILKTLNNKRL